MRSFWMRFQEDHERAIGDGEVGAEQGIAIAFVVGEVFERGSGRNDNQAAGGGDLVDGVMGGADKKSNAQYLLEADLLRADLRRRHARS
jgi:hypothetical protein